MVRWEVAPAGGGTLLTMTQVGLTERTARVYQFGTVAFLERLESQLRGAPLPDWEGRIREMRGPGAGWD